METAFLGNFMDEKKQARLLKTEDGLRKVRSYIPYSAVVDAGHKHLPFHNFFLWIKRHGIKQKNK